MERVTAGPSIGCRVRVWRSEQDPSKHELFIWRQNERVLYGRLDDSYRMVPFPDAQKIWDQETSRQCGEGVAVSGDKHFVQKFVMGDPEPSFAVDFVSLGFTCYWSNLQGGVSQWLCGVGDCGKEDKTDPLFEEMVSYRHGGFQRHLVSVPNRVYLYLAKLLELAPHMACSCHECNGQNIRNVCQIIIHLNNDGVDPRPLPGCYMVLTVCERVSVHIFFHILKGSKRGCRLRGYFRAIEGPMTEPDKCVYGEYHFYEHYKKVDTKMGDLDLFRDAGENDVLLQLGCCKKESLDEDLTGTNEPKLGAFISYG